MHKIKKCSDECGSSCYETGETQCACATNGYFDYIYTEDNVYYCKKLPYLNFKRYDNVSYDINCGSNIKGIDFWFYATEGVNDYSSSTLLFQIDLVSDGDTIPPIKINKD